MDDPRQRGSAGSGKRADGPSQEQTLAAVRRAALHGSRRQQAAPLRSVLEHLALGPRSAGARVARARLDELESAGELARSRANGVTVWGLTSAGAQRLEAACREGRSPVLPESPQHRSWRRARLAAGEEMRRFARALEADLAIARLMLDALDGGSDARPGSDAWLALGAQLLGDCRRLGSAWHCLAEWPEPDDASADRDEEPAADDSPAGRSLRALRAGRRNIALWREERG